MVHKLYITPNIRKLLCIWTFKNCFVPLCTLLHLHQRPLCIEYNNVKYITGIMHFNFLYDENNAENVASGNYELE